MKRPGPLYDFTAFGKAIKEARTKRGESRKKVSDDMNLSPRYLANIENKGQQPSLQIFYELEPVTIYPWINSFSPTRARTKAHSAASLILCSTEWMTRDCTSLRKRRKPSSKSKRTTEHRNCIETQQTFRSLPRFSFCSFLRKISHFTPFGLFYR